MTWPQARAALVRALAAVAAVDAAHPYLPWSNEPLKRGTHVLIAPPARSSERTPGGRTAKTYTVRLTVMRLLGPPDGHEAAFLAVDDAVEAIDAALEGHITLGGAATSTGAATWQAATVADWPPESRIWFVVMSGTLPVDITRTYEREA